MIFGEMNQTIIPASHVISHPEKPLYNFEELLIPTSIQDYVELLEWQAENGLRMKLSMTTRYHARLYFDSALANQTDIPLERYTSLLISSLALAIKSKQVSDLITPQMLMNGVGLQITIQEFTELEFCIIRYLQFQLRYKTPDDYLQQFLNVFPYHKKMFKNSIYSVIDLALIHKNTCQYTAEEIFFGGVLATIKIVPITLSDSELNQLILLTQNWTNAQIVCQMIEEQTEITDDELNQQ